MTETIPRTKLAPISRTARFEGNDFGSGSSFFWVRNSPGQGAELHRHPYSETFVVIGGHVTFHIEGTAVPAIKEAIVVVPAMAAHRFTNSGDGMLEMLAIHASPVMITEWLS